MSFETLAAAFVIGLLGAGHCIGMCGGISSALTFAIDKNKGLSCTGIIFGYNLGRIASYVIIGTLAAGLAEIFKSLGFPYFRVIAAVLMILMGFYLSGLWRILTVLEKGGKVLWRYIEPFGRRLMPVKSFHGALALGALWGWLPCGLVYTALAYSTAQADALSGALVMLAFGLGTMPAVVSGSLLADVFSRFIAGRGFRYLSAVAMILFGLWTLYGSLGHAGHGHHDAHGAHHSEERLAPTKQKDMHEHHHH